MTTGSLGATIARQHANELRAVEQQDAADEVGHLDGGPSQLILVFA